MSVATINTTGTCQFGSGGNLVTCQSIGPTGFGQVSNLCGPTAPGTPRKPKSPKSPGRAGANAFSGSGNSGGMKGTPKSPKGAKLSAVTKVLSSPPQQQPQQQQYQQQPQSASIVMASCPGASIPSVLLTGSLSQLQARQSNGTTMQPLPSGPTSAVSRPTSVQHFLATGSLPPPPPPHHLHQQQSQPQLSQQPQAMQQHVVSAAPAYLVQRHPGGQYQRAGGMLTAVSSCVQIPSQSAPLQQQRQFSQTQLSQPALYVRTTRQPYPAEVSDLVTTDHSSVAGAEQSINESLTSVLVTTGPSALPPQSSPYPPHVQLHHHQQAQSVVSFSQPMPQQMLLQQPAGHQLIQLKTSHGSQQTTQQLVDTTPGTNVCLSGMAQVGGVSLVGRMQPQQQLSTMSLGQQLTNHPSASMPQHNTGKPGTHHVQLSTVGRMSPVSSRVVPQTNQACYATQSQPQQQQQQPHSHHQQQKVKLSVPAAQFQGYVQAGQQPTQQIIFQSQTGQQLIAHHQPVAAAVSRGSVTPTGLSPSGVVLRAIGPHSAISTSASSTMCGILPTQSHLVTIASACAPQAPNQTAHMVNGVAGLQNSLLFQANQPTDCATLVQQSHQPMLQSHHHQQQQQRHQLYPHPQSAPQQQTGIPLQGQSGKPVQLPIQPQLVRPNQAGSVNVVGLNAGTVSYHTGVCALTPTSGGENISPQQHAAMVRAAGPNQAMVQLRHAQPVVPSQTLTRPVSCNQQPVPTPVAPTPLTAPPAPPILPTYYGHEGAPKPTRPEECLIGCVFLLLGYRAASESQRALWRRVMRSYGAEVVMAYDPNRVTHLVIDCQLEEPAIVKQIPDNQCRNRTGAWWNCSTDSHLYQSGVHKNRTTFYKCYDSTSQVSTSTSTPGSLTHSSLEVVPPSSPIRRSSSRLFRYAPLHRCPNPIQCMQKSREFRDLLARTCILSHLPPFRHTERVNQKELRSRRLDTYFCQYPAQDVDPIGRIHSVNVSWHSAQPMSVNQTPSDCFETSSCTVHSTDITSSIISNLLGLRHVSAHSEPKLMSSESFPSVRWIPSSINSQYCSHSMASIHHSASYPALTHFTRDVCVSERYTDTAPANDSIIYHSLKQNSLPDEFDPATVVSVHRSASLSKLDDRINYTPLHGSTDLSVWFPRSSSSYSSVDTSYMPPEPVIPRKEPPSPYVELDEILPQHSDPICLDHDMLDELRPLTRALSTVHVNPVLICAPVNGSTTPPSNSPSSSTLLLPDPPSRTKSSTTAPSTNSLGWPPTPSELQSHTTSHLRPHVIARCRVCLDVVNVLITPYNDLWMSTSPTQMSPPTEVPLLESFMDRDSSIPSHTTNNLGYSAIDAFGDQPMHVTGDLVSISERQLSDTTQIGGQSCDMQPIRATIVNPCLNRGDGVDVIGTKPSLSSKTRLSQPPLNIRVPEKNEGRPRTSEIKHPTIRKETGLPKPYGRREFRTVVSHLPTPCCLSDVFGSIRSRSLITSSPQLHQRYSTSLSSMSGMHMPFSFVMTRSRPELWIDDEVPMFSQLFCVPDVHGLRISVSNYGIALSPSACRLNNRLRTETTSRPADRRFQRILQRYPGSRADVLRETQRLHGAEYGFLILNTTAWNHMLCLTRDLDRCFPHWQLSRQLNRNRSARALRDRIRIVTIFWVNDVLSKGRMIPPYEILHLPSPFSNDITFSFIKSQIISLTGFEGKDRLKVEFMIRQLGASFTDYLEPSNTLLVCKRPEGKKYEMAQSWSVPCVNVRWLQDIYFGDLMALALDIPHKYLSFEPADVTVSLDRCTPRVQDLMIGWQTPIRLNHDAWTRLTKLSNDFAMEERERKRKLELDVISQPKSKKRTKCALAPLCEADVKLAMTCRTRLELLIAEAKEKGELQAALKEKLKRIVITEEQCPAQLPEVSELIKHGVQHKLADEECMLEGNETTHSYTSIQSEASEEPVVKSELALVGGGTLADSLTSQYALPNTPFSTSVDSLLESNQSNRPSALATSSFSAGPISTEPCAMIQVAPVVSPLTQAGGSVGNEVKLSDSPKQTECQRRNEVMTHDTVQSVVSLDVVHEASKAECEIISIKPEDESLGSNQTAVDRPVGGEVPQLSDELVAVRSNFSAPAVTISNADVSVNPSVVPSRKRTATDDLSDMNTKRPATDPLVDKGGIPETTCTVEIITHSQAPLISISAPSAEGLSAETPGSVVQTDTEAPVVKRSEDCIPPVGYPQSPATINTSVRIAFTAIDYESRLSLVELCLQLPDCQMVDSAEDATHLVCSRLLRTPKTYIAVALGRYLVTPKWIQASVLRGVWLDETPWLLSDPDAETQLGVRLSDSMVRARRRQMLGPEASLFAGLEFWLSPGACHREMCATLIKAGGGVVRHKRPTQKMALLPQPRQLIICHEDDSNVANYLMRLKTGNKAVHHEEFILSGVLRQELDYESYQIQYVNTLQSSLKAAVAAAEAALAHGGAMPQVPRTTVTECSGVNQAEVVYSTTGSRRPSLGTTECVSLDGRPVERDPRPINHSLLSTALPTRTSLESPRTPIIRTGSTDSSSDPSHSVSMNSYANLDTYAVLTSEARYSTSGTPLRPFAAQRQSVALTETPGHSMAPPIPKTHICRPTVPTGLQHLLADSMDHSHLPQDYYPISYRAHGPYDLVPSSRYRHPDAVHQSPLNTSTGTFCVTRATDGSSSYAGEIATAVNSSAAVSAYHHNVSPTTRHTYDPGPPGTEITSEPQRSISRPRAGGLLLSGPLTIPGTSYPTHRPVTALTAMIVAAESSTHDVASTEATGGTSVSTFVLPNSTAAFRAPCVTSSMMTQSSGLNARSAAADAHAVATATAAAANALIQSDRKSVVSLNDNGTSVPRARSPRTTLSASLFVADMSESKKPRIPVMHSISSGLSNASSLDAVTSLISAPMTFQMPVGTSDLTNLCRSYSPSVYSVGDHLHISTAHPVESVTALSCASTAAASLHSPVGRSLFPKVVSNFVDSDLARSASTELYPRLSVSSPSISSSVCLNSSTQSVTITENTAFLLMANNLMSTSGDIRPSVCPLPSSITLVSEPNHDHEQRNVHTTIASSSTHSASPSAEYRGALPSSNFESRI
ncbi:hypothetical protein EG68_03886 [Paragonimus skrjabini miyazakii]|uniref:PAX-interacting protein 1 n=1 Tax=Paragonimus skrjabini miyazakii TaxID=59628 RepID=A0A8S9YVK8_9TREM|nr:hypothetical protein EG68_03886 [Paragonimus skrjabini miyazakii]